MIRRATERIGVGLFALLSVCLVHARDPIPTFYQEPGLSPNRDVIDQHVSEKIDPFTGKLQIHAVDLFLPGNGGLDIKVQRSYSSVDELLADSRDTNLVVPSHIGVGWTMNFGRVLRGASIGICDNNQVVARRMPVLELPDGGRQILYITPDRTAWLTTTRWRARCEGSMMVVSSPDGTRYEMGRQGIGIGPATNVQNAWYASRIVDRNGNALELEYVNLDSTTAVSRVVGRLASGALDGREVTFTYQNNALATVSDGSRTWRYRHVISPDGGPTYPFLAEVERPDGQVWRFDYNLTHDSVDVGKYSMKQMTYPTGGSYSYTYGRVRFNSTLPMTTVVSTKTGSDGGIWTFAYDPASRFVSCVGADAARVCTFVLGSFDRTIITAPDATYEYAHIGANSVFPGFLWSVGLLLYKNTDSGYEIEQPVFGAQKISDIEAGRPGLAIVEAGIFAPIQLRTVRQRNAARYVTEYTNHDEFGNPQTIVETGPNGSGGTNQRTTTLTYFLNRDKWIIRLPQTEVQTEPAGTIGTISRTYDPATGNKLSETRYGVTTRWTYTADGDVATKTDARQSTSTYRDYKRGVPQTEEHPEGVTITRVVSNAGNVESETDGESKTVAYVYDGLNRITRITHPRAGSNPVTVDWSRNGRTVTRGSYKEDTVFDGFGRVASVTHQDTGSAPQSIVQTYRYDSYGRPIFASYPNDSKGTQTWFDVLGRKTKTAHATIFNGTADVPVTSSFYDGNAVRVTNERAKMFRYVYRGYGSPDSQDLVAVQAPVTEASISITRNALGQPLSVTQDGKQRRFEYYPTYFLWKQTDPETGVTEFGRDEIGNMVWRRVGTSAQTNFVYDRRNRLTDVLYPSSTTSDMAVAPNVKRTYYRDDKARTIENSAAVRTLAYDDNKNLVSEQLAVPGRAVAQIVFDYDPNDQLFAITYGSGAKVTYAPDALGRPTAALPYVTQVEHHPNGALKRLTYANGATTDVKQNARLWPEVISTGTAVRSISKINYMYDEGGNVKSMEDSGIAGNNWRFGYDDIDRLDSVAGQSDVLFGPNIRYDGRGNILSKSIGAGALNYIYDPATERLTRVEGLRQVAGSTFGVNYNLNYDRYGNVTGREGTSARYNDAQQMVCYQCGTANQTLYAYDGAGLRLRSQRGAQTTHFVHSSAGNLLWEADATSGEIKEYVYVAGKQVAVRRLRP
jgi:YD repeat-containing protein